MKTGESTGGRPPYAVEHTDIELARKMAAKGYSKKAIAKALEIDETPLYELAKRDEDFSKCIKRGVIEHCLDAEDKITEGKLSPTTYIYWSKTKWREFYPQEEKQESFDMQNAPNLVMHFTPPANHQTKDNFKLKTNNEASV